VENFHARSTNNLVMATHYAKAPRRSNSTATVLSSRSIRSKSQGLVLRIPKRNYPVKKMKIYPV